MTPISKNHKVCMKDRDCDAAPFLENILFEDPIPVLSFLESHEDQRSISVTDNKFEQGLIGSNVDRILHGHDLYQDDVRDSETASLSSFANESSGIGFLYQVK